MPSPQEVSDLIMDAFKGNRDDLEDAELGVDSLGNLTVALCFADGGDYNIAIQPRE